MIPCPYLTKTSKQICGDKTPQIVTQQQHKKIKIRKKKKKIWTFSLDQTLSIIWLKMNVRPDASKMARILEN